MEEKGCAPNKCTYNLLIRGLIHNDDISGALRFKGEMVAKGFYGDVSTCELFLDLVSKGKLDPSLQPVVKKIARLVFVIPLWHD